VALTTRAVPEFSFPFPANKQVNFPLYVKMKQSTLSFTAAKRTASNVNVAKRKVSASSAAEKAKAAKSSKKLPSKKRDVSDEESNNDDAVSKESNEEGVSQTSNSEEKQTKLSIPEDGGTHDPPQTRSVTEKAVPSTTMKRGSAKVQDLETRRSLPFRESSLTPEVLQNKINANDIDQLPELDLSNKKWNKQYAAARAKQGGQTTSECALVPV